MKIRACAATDRGQRRKSNEDRYLINESLGLYAICDGMGGHAAGEIASERAVAFATEFIREHRELLEKAGSVPGGYFRVLELAEDATQEASRRLHELANTDPDLAGMGTTMTMLIVVDNKAVMAHVGDSRLYVLRRGELHQLSADHTLANEMLQTGDMPPEEAERSRYKHVLTRTVGHQQSVQVESLLFDLFPGDTLLLCSDGLSNYFENSDAVVEILNSDDLNSLSVRLIDFANSRGGADNITLIVARAVADADDAEVADFEHRLDALKSTFLCQQLSVRRLLRLLSIASVIECAAGQTLFKSGQKCDGLYVVLDGSLTVEDNMALASELSTGDCLGETSLLGLGTIHDSIVANEPSRLLFISRSEFGKLSRRLPKLGNILLRNLGRHLSDRLDGVRCNDEVEPGDTGIWERRPC